MSKKRPVWTNQCQQEVTSVRIVEEFEEGWKPGTKLLTRRETETYQRPCDNYMPDDYERCDSCLLESYRDELGLGSFDSGNCCAMGPRMYEEENIIEALRTAETFGRLRSYGS